MDHLQFFLYLAVMAGSTYLIRAIPFALIKEKIENRFIRSFLYYIPYTVLTVMTFPGALYVTESPIAAAIGLIVAVILAVCKKGLTVVACAACAAVFIAETLISFL